MTQPNRVGVIVGDRNAALALLAAIGEALRSSPRSVSEAGLIPAPARSVDEVLDRLRGASLLFDLEALCWQPWVNANPLRFLRTHARQKGVLAVWPGPVRHGIASFSAPGRHDYVSLDASGFTVLHPVTTRFPDETPYMIERIP